MSSKQRMISADDLTHLGMVPDPAKPLAMWLWLHTDVLGRGPMNPAWIASQTRSTPETVETHLLELMEAGFITTFWAERPTQPGPPVEWILLLYPLKADKRGARVETPEPPQTGLPWNSMAVGGGRERARVWARERVRAEDAARASAWDAVREDREKPEDAPERPMLLDAPPMFCTEHMPHGAGQKKCGPCRDTRLIRDEWLTRRVYEQNLTGWHERTGDEEPW